MWVKTACLLLAGSVASANPVEISAFFLSECDNTLKEEKLSVMQPFRAIRVNDPVDEGNLFFTFAHPDKRYMLRSSIRLLPNSEPVFRCSVTNQAPIKEDIQAIRTEGALALLDPRERFVHSRAEEQAILNEAHTQFLLEFDYDEGFSKVLAANGTRFYYEGCLGGKEVTVTVGSLLGNWFLTAQTTIVDRGWCKGVS